MTKFISDRRLIVERVLHLIKPEVTEEDIDLAMKTWWFNIRSNGGFGLTDVGETAFTRAELEHWDFELKSVRNGTRFVLLMNKKMPAPYFIYRVKNTNMIRLYDSRIATMIALHGDAQEYIKNLDDRPKNS